VPPAGQVLPRRHSAVKSKTGSKIRSAMMIPTPYPPKKDFTTRTGPTPQDFISLPLVPNATPPGGPDFIVTVNGAGYVLGSLVNWNGSPRATASSSRPGDWTPISN
jgi:hypothetical protein